MKQTYFILGLLFLLRQSQASAKNIRQKQDPFMAFTDKILEQIQSNSQVSAKGGKSNDLPTSTRRRLAVNSLSEPNEQAQDSGFAIAGSSGNDQPFVNHSEINSPLKTGSVETSSLTSSSSSFSHNTQSQSSISSETTSSNSSQSSSETSHHGGVDSESSSSTSAIHEQDFVAESDLLNQITVPTLNPTGDLQGENHIDFENMPPNQVADHDEDQLSQQTPSMTHAGHQIQQTFSLTDKDEDRNSFHTSYPITQANASKGNLNVHVNVDMSGSKPQTPVVPQVITIESPQKVEQPVIVQPSPPFIDASGLVQQPLVYPYVPVQAMVAGGAADQSSDPGVINISNDTSSLEGKQPKDLRRRMLVV